MVWYRNETAIIKRKINEVTFYNKSSPASLGVQDTLVLQNMQPSDSDITIASWLQMLAKRTGTRISPSQFQVYVSSI